MTGRFEVKRKRIRKTTINGAKIQNSGSNPDVTAVHGPAFVNLGMTAGKKIREEVARSGSRGIYCFGSADQAEAATSVEAKMLTLSRIFANRSKTDSPWIASFEWQRTRPSKHSADTANFL